MDYGITDQGFIIKRLNDILTEQRQKATELFQDLLSPGDVVDTSDSSLLGRLIAIDAVGDADLWELGQQSWNALDPNSATGISLDNIVQYLAISRFSESPSTAIGLFSGDTNTFIPDGSQVSDSNTNNKFNVVGAVGLSPTQAAGIVVSVQSINNLTTYTIEYTTTLSSNNIVYTSSSSATLTEILQGLKTVVDSSHPLITAEVEGNSLKILRQDIFQASNFSTTTNLGISKVYKIGQLQAIVNGAIEQEANTITKIDTPVLGWDTITNPLAASPGRLRESDSELRERFRQTKLERSSNILDSLYSGLLNIDGVEEVKIYENDTSEIDSNGVLPHSFLPVILGGSSQIIAETIWDNKPMGILSQGNTTIPITDSQGFLHSIGFERPSPVNIYIILNLSADTESSTPFPSDGAEMIKEKIIAYAKNNFGVGKDVTYSRLFTPVNEVSGHQVDSMYIGTAPSPTGVSNIPVDFNEIASFQKNNIIVNFS